MKKLKLDRVVLPKFVENVDEYIKCLDVIAKHNFVDWSNNNPQIVPTVQFAVNNKQGRSKSQIFNKIWREQSNIDCPQVNYNIFNIE